MELLINWVVALAAMTLFFVGLYIVIKAATRAAIRESFRELGERMAKELWKDEGPGRGGQG